MVNHPIHSMTGFAQLRGAGEGHVWAWEIRSVNSKGLDVRLRLPDGVGGLEMQLRAAVAERFARGSISASLSLARDPGAAAGSGIDPAGLARALEALATISAEAARLGLELRQSSAAEVLALPGVSEGRATREPENEALPGLLMADFVALLDAMAAMRADEGVKLGAVIEDQIARIAALTDEAAREAEARTPLREAAFREALARVMQGAEGADPDRVAQELAMIAVKADVTEEIDRLRAHVKAARALLSEGGPVGRRLDFLAQEFNREANTLASKAGAIGLTRVALDLKAEIDRMREQIQNVE